jgi:hypothetical protein
MSVDYAASDRGSNTADRKLGAPVNVSQSDKFPRCKSHNSAIPFTNWSRRLTNQSRYPLILWISLSKKPIHKCVRLGFPRAVPVAQKLGTKDYLLEIM